MTTPLSYLDSAGPAAKPLAQLAWGLGGVATAVVALTAIALVWAIVRRRPASAPGLHPIGGTGAGLAWITIGLSLSVVVLVICTIWSLAVLGQVMHADRYPRLTVQVTAHQWWWEVRYLNGGPGVFSTANEIHIPVGEPVRVELSSPDVIHSFWVPKLAGKMDVIPGMTNVTWIEADHPGVFMGQCAEFCGLEHARMAFRVVADPSAQFEAWADRQRAPSQSPQDPDAASGARIFGARCASCHTISGTPAGGVVGPELSHLGSRTTLAAGALPNNPGSLAAWIADPQAVKPGARMPKVPMSSGERSQLVAYLQTLT